MKLLLLATVFAVGSYAACYNVTRIDDEMIASCVDDDGGEFHYMDINKTIEDSGISEQDMAAKMYEYYLTGAGNSTNTTTTTTTSSAADKRDKRSMFYWDVCDDNVAGRCDTDYTPMWKSGITTYQNLVRSLLQRTQDGRAHSSPRAICGGGSLGNVCVSWAAPYLRNLYTYQVQDIAVQCAGTCLEQVSSCEARARSLAETKYFCVSNRKSSCGAIDLRPC